MKMLFTGLARSVLGETVPSVGVPPLAYGLGRYPRPRAQFLLIRTSEPVNNIYIFNLTEMYIPLINRVFGPYCKLPTELFSIHL